VGHFCHAKFSGTDRHVENSQPLDWLTAVELVIVINDMRKRVPSEDDYVPVVRNKYSLRKSFQMALVPVLFLGSVPEAET
jgi:hypothetical protein